MLLTQEVSNDNLFFLTKTVMVYIRGVAKPQIQLQNGPEFLRAYRSKYKMSSNFFMPIFLIHSTSKTVDL